MKRRSVITGIGVVSPIGIGKDAFWAAARAGQSGIGPLTRLAVPDAPCQVAAEVRAFDPARYMDPLEARRMDSFEQYAVAAARLALEDAALAVTDANRDRVGLAVGVSLYGVEYAERQYQVLREKGVKKLTPYVPIAVFGCGPIGYISITFGITGWSNLISSCAASGTDAIGYAKEVIEEGQADVMLAGGTEAPFIRGLFMGLCDSGALSAERNGRARAASRPYDLGRDGFVLGEGAALVVLEAEEHARARGARVYAEVQGYGSATGPYDLEELVIDLDTADDALREALDDARCHPRDIDFVNANAASERDNDRLEAALIRRRYNGARPAVSSIRSMIGQTLGAAGGFQAAVGALAIAEGFIPPTINYTDPDPHCPVDALVREGTAHPIRRVIQHSYSYLGTQSALVLGRYEA